MDWTVRQATSDTAPIVHEIARESWHAASDDFLGPETVDEFGVSFYEPTGFDRIETRPTDLGDRLEEYVYKKLL